MHMVTYNMKYYLPKVIAWAAGPLQRLFTPNGSTKSTVKRYVCCNIPFCDLQSADVGGYVYVVCVYGTE